MKEIHPNPHNVMLITLRGNTKQRDVLMLPKQFNPVCIYCTPMHWAEPLTVNRRSIAA